MAGCIALGAAAASENDAADRTTSAVATASTAGPVRGAVV